MSNELEYNFIIEKNENRNMNDYHSCYLKNLSKYLEAYG